MINNDQRFKVVHASKDRYELGGYTYTAESILVKDQETGVLYYRDTHKGGITPLLGSDGKPIIEPVE